MAPTVLFFFFVDMWERGVCLGIGLLGLFEHVKLWSFFFDIKGSYTLICIDVCATIHTMYNDTTHKYKRTTKQKH